MEKIGFQWFEKTFCLFPICLPFDFLLTEEHPDLSNEDVAVGAYMKKKIIFDEKKNIFLFILLFSKRNKINKINKPCNNQESKLKLNIIIIIFFVEKIYISN